MFVNAAAGDLHLVAGATAVIDRVAAVANVTNDWDGDARPQGAAADYGADEVGGSAPTNKPPTVTLSGPANGTSYTAPATIAISASASDSDGSVSRVEFYAGTTLVGSDTTSPFSYSWTGVAAGTYVLKAIAYDDAGASATSSTASVTVTGGTTTPPPTQLPSPWSTSDIGAPAVAGSATYANSTFTVKGAGSDIWNSSDQFRYVYQTLQGDGEIVARVATLSGTDAWAKAGVMFRESLAANSKQAVMLVSRGQGSSLQSRASTGGSSVMTGSATSAVPLWVRIVRKGTTFTASRSTNGTTWTQVGSVTISMATTAYVGLAITSHSATSAATATFDNAKATVTAPTSTALPSPWTSGDIGSPALAGSAQYASGVFTVWGGGNDIWDTADQFRFVYQTLKGDGEIVARVASLVNTNEWAKSGVMIRETLTPGSRNASMFVTPTNGWTFQGRAVADADTVSTVVPGGTAPTWVRLVRAGSTFTAYQSSNGTSWTVVGSGALSMGSTVYVGLAVTGHNPGTATKATFDNVKVSVSANQAPSVSLTSPVMGASMAAPGTVGLVASAADSDGTISKVDFYAGTTLVGSATASPYTASWVGVAAGTYALKAVATDNGGLATTSATVSITVSAATALPVEHLLTFNASPDHTTTVTSSSLQVFRSGAAVTSTPAAAQSLGKPAVVNGEISVDIEPTLRNLPAGSYFTTVSAIASKGTAQSTPSNTFSH